MNAKTRSSLLCAALSLTAACSAPGASASDWYGEFGLSNVTRSSTLVDSDRNSGYDLGFGWRANKNVSLQFDWVNYGNNPDTCTFTVPPVVPTPCVAPVYPEQGYQVRVIGRFPASDWVALEVGGGMVKWLGTAGGVSARGTEVVYSVGAAWRINDEWSFGLEYRSMKMDLGLSVTTMDGTLRFRF